MNTKQTNGVRVQHSAPSLAQVVQDVEAKAFVEYPEPHVTFVFTPSLFAHVLAVMNACASVNETSD